MLHMFKKFFEPSKKTQQSASFWKSLYNTSDTPVSLSLIQQRAFQLWKKNPLANRMIELPIAYTLDNDLRYTSLHPEHLTLLDSFLTHPDTDIIKTLPEKMRSLSIFGEQFWPVFVNSLTGHTTITDLHPSLIQKVIFDPENANLPIGVITNESTSRSFQTALLNECSLSPQAQMIRQSLTDGQCFYFRINTATPGERGQSDLLPQIQWLEKYDQSLMGEMERWELMRTFLWDVEIQNATPEEIRERAQNLSVPPSGSIRIHNNSEKWNTVTPGINAQDHTHMARLFRNHIIGGSSIPEHWYGGGGDINRATASAMSEPTYKIFSLKQRIWKGILETVFNYSIQQRLFHLNRNYPQEIHISVHFSSINKNNSSESVEIFEKTIRSVTSALSAQLITQDQANTIINSLDILQS